MVVLTVFEEVVLGLNLAVTFVSILGSLATLYLIYAMKRWNGYLLLIVNLTVAQVREF